jgi:hypothetical protein
MEKRRLSALAVCLVLCLAIGSMTAASAAPGKGVKYWDYHYLAGQAIQPGFDIFGFNFQARTAQGPVESLFRCWYGLPPYEGEVWLNMLFQWNEAYLGTKDYDGDGYLDWQPFTSRDHYEIPWDWQGSGAVCSWDQKSNYGTWAHMTVAAAPEDAWPVYESWPASWDPDLLCECQHWYAPDGTSLGDSPPDAPAGDRLQWILVKHIHFCDKELVCHYDNPVFRPDWGKQ